MKIEIRTVEFVRLLASVVRAASDDESRSINNIEVRRLPNGSLQAVGTDGHWLARYQIPAGSLVSCVGDDCSKSVALIPRGVAKTLIKAAKSQTLAPTVELDFDARTANVYLIGTFSWPNVDAATFPPYERVFPHYDESNAAERGLPAIYVDCAYLVDVCASAKDAHWGEKKPSPFLLRTGSTSDDLSPLLFTAGNFTAILMRMRGEEVADCEIHRKAHEGAEWQRAKYW